MCLSYAGIIFAFSILLLSFLYKRSQTFRYNLKFALYVIILSFNCLILLPILIFRAKNVRNLVIISYLCRQFSILIGIKWILKGKEHLEKDQSYIIVSNHQSSLDILGMFDIWHIMDKCTVVARKELMYSGPFGLAAWLSDLIFIDRTNTEKAQDAMQEAAERIKSKNIKLWIFPEGTRRNTGEIHAFKKGAFHLAIASQIPILPVVYSRYYFLDDRKKRFDQGKIIITALPPISTKGMIASDVNSLMEKTREAMTLVYQESSKEVMSLG